MSTAVLVNPLTLALWSLQAAAGGATTRAALGVLVDVATSGGAATIQVPTGAVQGSVFAVRDGSGSAATFGITIDGDGALLDGAASVVLRWASALAVFIFDSGQWRRVVPSRRLNGLAPSVEFLAELAQALGAYVAVEASTTDAVATRVGRYPIASGAALALRFIVTCQSSDGSGAVLGEWNVSGSFKRPGGVLAVGVASTITNLYKVGLPVGPTLTLNGNTDVDLNVTGIAATALSWKISEFAL